MNLKKHILSLLAGIFIFATLADAGKVLVVYSIYYYDYQQSKEECYNEKPDMFDSGQLYLKALIKRVNDICPNHKPKPPKVESSNIVLYINHLPVIKKPVFIENERARFIYSFNYDFQSDHYFFRPPIQSV